MMMRVLAALQETSDVCAAYVGWKLTGIGALKVSFLLLSFGVQTGGPGEAEERAYSFMKPGSVATGRPGTGGVQQGVGGVQGHPWR